MPGCLPTSRSGCSSGSKLVLLEPNPPAALDLLLRVLGLRLPHLRNLPLQHFLRHLPIRWIRIHTAHMDCIDAHIRDVPTAESSR
jgi:hypothetical protein